MSILGTGDVGIGVINPQYSLDVDGTINARDFLKNGQPLETSTPWDVIPGGINYPGGNVGIGTQKPETNLEIREDANQRLGPILGITNKAGDKGAAAALRFGVDATNIAGEALPNAEIRAINLTGGRGNNPAQLNLSVESGDGLVELLQLIGPETIAIVNGTLDAKAVTANIKNFAIEHPIRAGYELIHSSLEGPEAAVFYRGEAQLSDGKALIRLPDYFEALTQKHGRTVQLTPKGAEPYLLSYTDVVDGHFTAYGTNPEGRFTWEVKAVRADVDLLTPEVEKR